MKKAITIFVAVLAMSQAGFGVMVDNTAWQNEYTVNANTVALYHFNMVEELGDGTGHFSREETHSSSTKWAAVTYDTAAYPATSQATFVDGGKFGGGLNNTGADGLFDSAKLNDSQDLFPGGEDPSLSVECWVKFDSLDDFMWIVDKKYSWSGNHGGYGLYRYSDGSIIWELGDGTITPICARTYAGDVTLVTGQWYHIAGTWDADTDTASLYIDDQMIASSVYAGSVIHNSDPMQQVVFTNRCGSTYKSLDGTIDEFMISDVAYNYIVPEPATLVLLALGSILVGPKNRKTAVVR